MNVARAQQSANVAGDVTGSDTQGAVPVVNPNGTGETGEGPACRPRDETAPRAQQAGRKDVDRPIGHVGRSALNEGALQTVSSGGVLLAPRTLPAATPPAFLTWMPAAHSLRPVGSARCWPHTAARATPALSRGVPIRQRVRAGAGFGRRPLLFQRFAMHE